MDKSSLRRHTRELRSAQSVDQRARASVAICTRILELPEYQQAHHIMLYGASPDEVSVDLVSEDAQLHGRETYFPRVANDHLHVIHVSSSTVFTEGYRGILEPEGEPVDPSIIDLVIVPGLAFDDTGRRLGQGKAYYDRLLPLTSAYRIAVAFDCQLVARVPTDPHDQFMDLVVTESRIVVPQNRATS